MNEPVLSSLIKLIKKSMRSYKGMHITWFGGEPSLSLDIIETVNTVAIKYARLYGKLFTSAMTTNGYLLNEDVFARLLSLNIRSYQITIDGVKSVHDLNRKSKEGDGTFDKIIENIKNIKNHKTGLFNILIRCNLNNLDVISDFATYMSSIVGKDKRFGFLFYPICNWPKSNQSSVEMFEIMKEADKYKNDINIIKKSADYANYCNANKNNYYVVSQSGDLYKCTIHLKDDFNKVGYISENGDIKLFTDKMLNWSLLYRYLCVDEKERLQNIDKILCPYNNDVFQSKLLPYYLDEEKIDKLMR